MVGRETRGWGREGGRYGIIEDILVAGIVIDVDCDAAQSGDFGGEFVEAGVVLAVGGLAFVSLGWAGKKGYRSRS